jgi:hypothetical protein
MRRKSGKDPTTVYSDDCLLDRGEFEFAVPIDGTGNGPLLIGVCENFDLQF